MQLKHCIPFDDFITVRHRTVGISFAIEIKAKSEEQCDNLSQICTMHMTVPRVITHDSCLPVVPQMRPLAPEPATVRNRFRFTIAHTA